MVEENYLQKPFLPNKIPLQKFIKTEIPLFDIVLTLVNGL